MKRIITLCILFIAAMGSVEAQTSQDVSFVHGLGDTPSVWDDMAAQLGQEFVFSRDNVTYNDTAPISTAVAGTSFPSNTVTVAHSLGGLISREYLNQNGTGAMQALITVGTPNNGAPVADVIQNGEIEDLIEVWYERLLAGPLATADLIIYYVSSESGAPPFNLTNFRNSARDFTSAVLAEFGLDPNAVSAALTSQINTIYGDLDSVDDMRPGSAFLSQLNASPGNTLPASRYAIYGGENLYSYVRMFDSFQNKNFNGNPLEYGSELEFYYAAGGYWLWVSAVHAFLSRYYHGKANAVGPGHPDYFRYMDYRFLFAYASQDWFLGFVSLAALMPLEWKANITQSLSINPTSLEITAQADDGLLNRSTQAPAYFDVVGDNIDRQLPALGANHIEETVHPSVKERLVEIFGNPDVNIQEVSSGGDGGDDDPPQSCPPCLQCPCY